MENEILHLPMVALRGMTVMPGKTVHFDISRERSIQAVQEAMTGNQRIFLTAQKKIETDEPKMEDVYEVGTIAVIQQIAKLPRQIMRVMVTGETRGILKQIEEEDPYLLAEAEVVDESGFERYICGICRQKRKAAQRTDRADSGDPGTEKTCG